MQAQNVVISAPAHQLLLQLAELEQISIQTVLDRALESYRRELFLKQANAAFDALKQDTEAWGEELEERELWDSTLADGANGE